MLGADFWKALPSLDGPQLIVALVVLAMVMGFFAARFFFASGKDKLVAQQADKQDAITVLSNQIVRLQNEKGEVKTILEQQIVELKEQNAAQIAELKAEGARRHAEQTAQASKLEGEVNSLRAEVRRLSDNEARNQDYRHALANRCTTFEYAYDVAHGLLIRVCDEWKQMPEYFTVEIAQLKRPMDLAAAHKLPGAST